ncbi:ciliary microtubule associated protein 1A [Hydra vulgaris]|uniref:ciliary microtubule associated protein 1A n=1 Tax=Hydra vulgaris TaxID=6087 RepID=UPI001F5E362D|nr:outer dense fiber protein 3-like [Hydra vulgaris]
MAVEATENKKPMISAMFRGPGPCYMMPGTTGYIGHDVTKKTAPHYVFGIKTKLKDETTPGPAAYKVDPKVTRFGKDGLPEYTLHYRPKELTTFITPAPGTYQTENAKILKYKTSPSFTIAGRTRYGKKDHIPGPSSYNLPTMFGSKIPIKSSPPSFSMSARSKFGGFNEDLKKTPGPGTYNSGDPNSWKIKAPMFSMAGRSALPTDKTQNPGPAKYLPGITKGTTPKFSFGVRHSEYVVPLIADVSCA